MMRTRTTRTTPAGRAGLLWALSGVLLLGGCAGDRDDAGDAAADRATTTEESGEAGWVADDAVDGATDEEAPAEEAADADAEVVDTVSADRAQPVAGRTGRRIVRTARLELHVENGRIAADEVARVAERRGGFVAETDLARDAEGVVRGSITLRVPSDELFDTVEELDALAVAVPIRRIDEEDVTAESADLQARLTNLETYEIELRTLLADVRETTTRPDDLLTVFERIRSVRAEIDQAEARLAVLDDAVALSTVQVTLLPAASATPVVDPTWAPLETVREALTTTARALSGIADAAIRFALTVLPIGLLLGSPLLVAVVVWRRYRARRPERAAEREATPPEAPATS